MDDRAAARVAHVARDALREEPEPAHVHREDLVPALDRVVERRRAPHDAGVVHEHVEARRRRERPLDEVLDRLGLRDVALEGGRRAARARAPPPPSPRRSRASATRRSRRRPPRRGRSRDGARCRGRRPSRARSGPRGRRAPGPSSKPTLPAFDAERPSGSLIRGSDGASDMTLARASRDPKDRRLGARALRTRRRLLDATAALLARARPPRRLGRRGRAPRRDVARELLPVLRHGGGGRAGARRRGRRRRARPPRPPGGSTRGRGRHRERQGAGRALPRRLGRAPCRAPRARTSRADEGSRSFRRAWRTALRPLLDALARRLGADARPPGSAQPFHPYAAAAALATVLESVGAYHRELEYFGSDARSARRDERAHARRHGRARAGDRRAAVDAADPTPQYLIHRQIVQGGAESPNGARSMEFDWSRRGRRVPARARGLPRRGAPARLGRAREGRPRERGAGRVLARLLRARSRSAAGSRRTGRPRRAGAARAPGSTRSSARSSGRAASRAARST